MYILYYIKVLESCDKQSHAFALEAPTSRTSTCVIIDTHDSDPGYPGKLISF